MLLPSRRCWKGPPRWLWAHLEAQVPDAELRARLTPDYAIGCKRILKSSDFYPALMRDNVDLVTERIECIEAAAVVTAGGHRHDIDALVLATVFEATEPPIAKRIIGRGALRLDKRWSNGAEAYKNGCGQRLSESVPGGRP